MAMIRKDYTGKRLGNLLAVCPTYKKDDWNSTLWECKCSCGKKVIKSTRQLTRMQSLHCGCSGTLYESHKDWGSPEYISYTSMITRCTNPNRESYKNYGGRGIKICERWRSSYTSFLEDMGRRPEPKEEFSLERKDVDGDYSPENCVWADITTQARNHRKQRNNTSGHIGVSFHKGIQKWTAQITVSKKQKYLGSFEDIEDAIITRKKAEEKYWN